MDGEAKQAGDDLRAHVAPLLSGEVAWNTAEGRALVEAAVSGPAPICSREELLDLLDLSREIDALGLEALRDGQGFDPAWSDVAPAASPGTSTLNRLPADAPPPAQDHGFREARSASGAGSRRPWPLILGAAAAVALGFLGLRTWLPGPQADPGSDSERPRVLGSDSPLDPLLERDAAGEWRLRLESLPADLAEAADSLLGEVELKNDRAEWNSVFRGRLTLIAAPDAVPPASGPYRSAPLEDSLTELEAAGERECRWRVWLERPGDDSVLASSDWRYSL